MSNMQDPYSAMMSTQRSDLYKSFNRQGSNTSGTTDNSGNSSFYQGLQQYANFAQTQDIYQSMSMPTSHMPASGQDYNSPLPAHMGAQNPLPVGSNGISRGIHPTTHTITHTATSPPVGSPQNSGMSNLVSPGPSTSRLSMSPDTPSQGQPSSHSQISSNHSPGEIVKQESSDNSSVKSGNEEDSGVPPKKRVHSMSEDEKDPGYWEKRKKNNESAKRSREARRMKEEQIALRVVYLEQENLQLRTEVSLLKSEIEKLRCMLYNS